MHRKHSRLQWPLIAALCAALAAGCGGADEPAVSKQPPPGRNIKRRAERVEKEKPPARRPASNKKSRPKKENEETPIPPVDPVLAAADPDDVFEFASEEPNFEIVGREPGPPGGEEFSLVRLPAGLTSSDFLAYQPPPSGSPPANPLTLPDGFTPLEKFGYSEQGLPRRIRCEKDRSEMVLIPAGVFELGTSHGPPECGPPLSIYLDSYYIDVTEVTVANFQEFVDERGLSRREKVDPADFAARQKPVVNVTWSEADLYAKWVNKSLPTEAQWEKAARSEQNFEHVWGNGHAIWARDRQPGQIDPVRSFPTDVSPYGLFDLAGNAREWCLDVYMDNAFQEASAQTAATLRNWAGPRASSQRTRRVVKGGGTDWKAWFREGMEPRASAPDLGFRCVLTISTPP